MPKQLTIFAEEGSYPEEVPIEREPECDWIMEQLDAFKKGVEATNKLLGSMIARLQEGWTEDEKLQINDPKEWQRRNSIKQPKNKIMPELSSAAIDILKGCSIDGMVIKLPEGQLERNIYTEVKNRMELIGGKWKGGKIGGFVFPEDPSDLLAQIANGEKRNLKKEFQFFGTPDLLADRLVELADIRLEDEILEPSAGQGAIVKAIHRATNPGRKVSGYELMPLNQTFLQKIGGFRLLGNDFLTECETEFDKIIANPPFSKNQDIDHIMYMYQHLKPGGRLVSVASKHWLHSNKKKEAAFRDFLLQMGAEIIEVDAGEFKESGTLVATVIIIIEHK